MRKSIHSLPATHAQGTVVYIDKDVGLTNAILEPAIYAQSKAKQVSRSDDSSNDERRVDIASIIRETIPWTVVRHK